MSSIVLYFLCYVCLLCSGRAVCYCIWLFSCMILHWVFFSLFHCIGLYSDNSAPYSDIALYHQGDRVCGSQTVKLSATMLYYNRRDRIKTMAMRLMVCGCAVFRWKWAIKRVIRQRAVAKVTVGFIDDIELYPVLYSILMMYCRLCPIIPRICVYPPPPAVILTCCAALCVRSNCAKERCACHSRSTATRLPCWEDTGKSVSTRIVVWCS